MRTVLIVAAFALSGEAHAHFVPHQGCISVGDGYQRVAAEVATPADCCTGPMQCPKFLSTTKLVRPGRDQHA
jgi:hypothetical protein